MKPKIMKYFIQHDVKVMVISHIPHGTRKRTITTIFGDLTYRRHRYRHWDKYKYRFVYLSDLALGIENYQRITNHLTIKILDLIAEGKRYQDILDCFPSVNFGCRTISNIIRRTKINSLQDVIEHKVKKVTINKCLYINKFQHRGDPLLNT